MFSAYFYQYYNVPNSKIYLENKIKVERGLILDEQGPCRFITDTSTHAEPLDKALIITHI